MTRRNRRSILKSIGASGIVGLAGCSGNSNQQGDASSGSGGGGATTTSTSVPVEELSQEEWRKLASEKAAQELQNENLQITSVMKPLVETWEQWDYGKFSSVYQPLTDNVSVRLGPTSQFRSKYNQRMNAGQKTSDVLRWSFWNLLGITEFGDLSNIPGFKNAPPKAKVGSNLTTFTYQGGSIAYNTDMLSSPPNYQDLLSDSFAPEQVGIDFTPPTDLAGVLLNRLGKEYFTKMKNQNPVFIRALPDVPAEVAKGNIKAGLVSSTDHTIPLRAEGEPVDNVMSPDVMYWRLQSLGMGGNPKHPWAAKLWIDYALSDSKFQLQGPATGIVTTNGEGSDPSSLKQHFNPENIIGMAQLDRKPKEIATQWRELLGAPAP